MEYGDDTESCSGGHLRLKSTEEVEVINDYVSQIKASLQFGRHCFWFNLDRDLFLLGLLAQTSRQLNDNQEQHAYIILTEKKNMLCYI